MIERSAHYREHVSPKKAKAKLSNSLGKKLKPHTIEVSSGDEKTLLDPINYGIRDARMAPKDEYQSKPKKKKSSVSKHDLDEPYQCPEPGCSNRFINQSELDNHMTARHRKPAQSPSPRSSRKSFPIAVRSKPRERKLLSDDEDDDSDPKEKERSPVDLAVLRRDSTEDDIRSEIALSVSALSRMSMSDFPASSTHSIYTDITDAALSDIAETESQEVQRPVRILIALWNKLMVHYVNEHTHGAGHENESGQRPGGRQNARRTSSSSIHKRSSSLSSSTTSKRSLPSDDEGDGRKKPRLQKPVPRVDTISPKDRPVGCPFNKFDNIQFGEGNPAYHVCSTWNSVKTAYLKQHLQRTHCPSPHCCPRCQKVFKNAALLQEHQRQAVSCEIQELDKQKISPEHQEVLGLRNRNAVGMDRERYWFQVFDTVFPQERQKPNRNIEPYYKGPAHEVLDRFLRFSEVRLPHVLAQVRRELRIESDNTPEKDAELCRMILQEANQAFMEEMANAPPIDLRQLNKQASTLPVIDDAEGEETVKLYDPPRQPQPQSTVNTSEADFAQIGQSTYVHLQQVAIPPAARHQAPHQPSHPPDTVEPGLLTTHPYQQSTSQDYGAIGLTRDSLQQLLDDPNFTRDIESVDMFGASDIEFHGFEYVERNP